MKTLSLVFGGASLLMLLVQSFILLTSSGTLGSADILVLTSTSSFLSTLFIGLGVALKG